MEGIVVQIRVETIRIMHAMGKMINARILLHCEYLVEFKSILTFYVPRLFVSIDSCVGFLINESSLLLFPSEDNNLISDFSTSFHFQIFSLSGTLAVLIPINAPN